MNSSVLNISNANVFHNVVNLWNKLPESDIVFV